MAEPTETQIDAALRVVRDEWGSQAPEVFVHRYLGHNPEPGPEREAALAALKAADVAAEREEREVMRRVLRAALEATEGEDSNG